MERFHQTLKRYLAKQAPAASLAVLQLQLDTFRAYYNNHRPHRALHGATPLVAFNARLKAHPAAPVPAVHCRVRQDRVSAEGKVTLRYMNRLLHIGVGRAFKHSFARCDSRSAPAPCFSDSLRSCASRRPSAEDSFCPWLSLSSGD